MDSYFPIDMQMYFSAFENGPMFTFLVKKELNCLAILGFIILFLHAVWYLQQRYFIGPFIVVLELASCKTDKLQEKKWNVLQFQIAKFVNYVQTKFEKLLSAYSSKKKIQRGDRVCGKAFWVWRLKYASKCPLFALHSSFNAIQQWAKYLTSEI